MEKAVTSNSEDFDYDHQRSLKRDVIAHLGTLDFVAAKENVIFLGPLVIDGLIFERPLSCRSPCSCDLCHERPAVVAS